MLVIKEYNILLTVSIIFLVLLIHLLLLFIIYFGLAVLVVLLEERLGVSDSEDEWRKVLRRTGEAVTFPLVAAPLPFSLSSNSFFSFRS